MNLKLLGAGSVSATLCNLIDTHDEFHWAVAWGSMTIAATEMLKHPDKFKNVTFGVAFSQTDPILIERLVDIKGARVATKFTGGTYHPKVYCFRSGTKAAAVVGSANFTFGGLDKNHEAAILVEGTADDPFFTDLFDFTERSAGLGEPITAEYAAAYRTSHKRASRLPKPPRDPMDGLPKIKTTAISSPLISTSWTEYASQIRASQYHDVDDSLELLRIAQAWFASAPSFSTLSLGQRQAIAGLVVDKAQRGDSDLGRDWGWFGSMKGMGDFAKLVIANDKHLARALDSVPQKGEISRQHFKNFVRHFERAFQNSDRTGGYATASRLLAMKRPDTFICICNPNITEAAKQMGFAWSRLALEDYWDKVVEIIRLAEWYNANKPDDSDGALWESRVAMLDAVLYRPT